jgi:hypothetical protein
MALGKQDGSKVHPNASVVRFSLGDKPKNLFGFSQAP